MISKSYVPKCCSKVKSKCVQMWYPRYGVSVQISTFVKIFSVSCMLCFQCKTQIYPIIFFICVRCSNISPGKCVLAFGLNNQEKKVPQSSNRGSALKILIDQVSQKMSIIYHDTGNLIKNIFSVTPENTIKGVISENVFSKTIHIFCATFIILSELLKRTNRQTHIRAKF